MEISNHCHRKLNCDAYLVPRPTLTSRRRMLIPSVQLPGLPHLMDMAVGTAMMEARLIGTELH